MLRVASQKKAGVKISAVQPGSEAEQAGLRAGDVIRELDGHALEDALDLTFQLQGQAAGLKVWRDGAELSLFLPEMDGTEPGWELEPLEMRLCCCDCIFCFVQQLPKGLRASLYNKDEDYRFSFLFGNYLTLVGFTSRDLERVLKLRLSPLYVSIHATDPPLRGRLLRVKRAPILPMLEKLVAGGIEIHGQIVLVPQWNDGEVLVRTLEDLAHLYPGLASLSVVPVGLTGHRQALSTLRLLNHDESLRALEIIRSVEKAMHELHGRRWIYPADELLLKLGEAIPPAEVYEGYPQLENGVGLCRWTMDQASEALRRLPKTLLSARRLLWVTGLSAESWLKSIAENYQEQIRGLKIDVLAVENSLLGQTVTVAGLLGGKDIAEAIRRHLSLINDLRYDRICLPPDCLNSDGLLLDDWTPQKIAEQIGLPVEVFNGNWAEMIQSLEARARA